ncbi:MAG: hypothetical protein A2X01_04180, partial [Bacteroidetes bacterium GWF2_35_48]
MKKFISIFILFPFFCFAQHGNYPGYVEDNHDLDDNENRNLTNRYAPIGSSFTPKGDFKGLVVYVGFSSGSDYDQSIAGWRPHPHTDVGFPNFSPVNSGLPYDIDMNTGTAINLFYSNNSQFTQYASDPNIKNISKFYYEMSKGQFRFTLDVYKESGVPKLVLIDPSSVIGTGQSYWRKMNRLVYQTIAPHVAWSNYDNRTNSPAYDINYNYLTTQPDFKPDFIIIIYRVMNGMLPVDVTNFAASSPEPAFSYDGYDFIGSGYTQANARDDFNSLFIHEAAHQIFGCPHYGGANQVSGAYFFPENGWGMMNIGSGAFWSALGWERWYLDWIQLKSNNQTLNSNINTISDLPLNGEFILSDFILSGDVVRIKIPNGTGKNQYLWLENHQGYSIFDNRQWIEAGDGLLFPASPRGIMAYIEAINDDKHTPSNVASGAGGIKYIHSMGKFDFAYDPVPFNPSHLWDNAIYNFSEGVSNPISGQMPCNAIMNDFYGLDETITKTYATNSTSTNDEAYWIVQQNGTYTDMFIQGGSSFQIGQKYGISTNPLFINYPNYYSSLVIPTNPYYSTMPYVGSYYLNGISIELLEQYSDGRIRIKVRLDDVDVVNDTRWSGNIELNDITQNSNPDVSLQTGKTITIDKSGTPNRHTKVNGAFINPTIFICKSNSYFKQQTTSNVEVINGSGLLLEASSTYEVNSHAKLTVKNGSTLLLRAGSNLLIKGTGKLVIEEGAYICIENGANIILQDVESIIDLQPGFIYGSNSTLSTFLSLLPNCMNFCDIAFTGLGSITNETHYSTAITWSNRDYLIVGKVYIENSSSLTIANANIYFSENAKIIVKPKGRLLINDLGNLTTTCNNLWQGIEVWGNPNQNQSLTNQGFVRLTNGATIENAIFGIVAGKMTLSTSNALFPNNYSLDATTTGGIIWADGAKFINNQIGI